MGGCTQQKRTSRLEQHSQRQANLSCVSQQRHQKPLAMHHRSLLMTLLIHQQPLNTNYNSLTIHRWCYHIFIPFFGNSRLYILHLPPNPLLSPQQSTCHPIHLLPNLNPSVDQYHIPRSLYTVLPAIKLKIRIRPTSASA
jgi:hypothetical protein